MVNQTPQRCSPMKRLFTLFLFFCFFQLSGFAKNHKVVFVQDDMSNDFRKAQVLEVEKHIQGIEGVEFSYTNAKGRLSLFIYHLEKTIKKGADIILIGTPSASAISPALKKAKQQGIKTIIIDRGVTSSDYTTFLNSDNIKIGEISAKYIVDKLQGKGKVLLLEGLPKADVTQHRTKGFMDVVANYPDIKVVQRVGNFLRKDAIREMEKLLDNNATFDAIFAESDSMLAGVRSVFKARDLDISKLITVGCDYTSQARQAIIDGKQDASVKFPLAGKESVEVVKKLIANESVEKHMLIPVQLINSQNVISVDPIF